jgi:hypothetical protein
VKAEAPAPANGSSALDIAAEIWQTFCDQLKVDPSAAKDQLIKTIVLALSASEPQDGANHGNSGPADPAD